MRFVDWIEKRASYDIAAQVTIVFIGGRFVRIADTVLEDIEPWQLGLEPRDYRQLEELGLISVDPDHDTIIWEGRRIGSYVGGIYYIWMDETL